MKDDAQLIRDALGGDSAAFGQLVTRYQDRLFNTLVHVTGCAEEAEDVAQETFVKAYLKLDSFGGRSAFYTWLYRIAFNLSVSRQRRRRREVSIDRIREMSGNDLPDGGEVPAVKLERAERVAQVQSALGTLSEEHRTILVLREMDGCCYETIADILEMPVGTVRSRLHRARLQLRQRLQELVEESS